MPGSAAGRWGGWGGREPLAVVIARTLAPWPLWLIMWEVLRPDALRGGAILTPVVATLLVGLMAQRAARGADRTLRPELMVGLVGLSLLVALLFEIAAAFTWYGRGFAPNGLPLTTLVTWLGGAALYEGFVRTLREPDDAPAGSGTAAHAILFAGTWLGLVGIDSGLPLPFVVGPLVAIRLVGGHDARIPLPRPGHLATRTVLGAVATVTLLGAVLDASPPSPAPAAVGWSVLVAGGAALVAALALASRARFAASALTGVVHAQREGGIVLSMARGEEHVHVVPMASASGGHLPPERLTVTFLDVEPGPRSDTPYRAAPTTVRARVLWPGDADQMASTLLSRAWGWLAWSALTFAAAVQLLGG